MLTCTVVLMSADNPIQHRLTATRPVAASVRLWTLHPFDSASIRLSISLSLTECSIRAIARPRLLHPCIRSIHNFVAFVEVPDPLMSPGEICYVHNPILADRDV